jgi:serine/threonine protein kinase
VLEDGEEVAVKMLRFLGNINDQQFENEFDILKRLKHPNIVRLVGFCNEAKEELVEYNGKLIVCQRIHRALCLEYMPKGSLGKLLTGWSLPYCMNILPAKNVNIKLFDENVCV